MTFAMHKTLTVLACVLFFAPILRGQSLGPDTVSVELLLDRADRFRQEEKVLETLQAYFTGLRASESRLDTLNIIRACTSLGEYYERFSRPNEAIPYYYKAYNLSRHTDSLQTTARLSNLLAWNYHKTKQVDSALRFAEEAVRRQRALPSRNPVSYAVALESLGEIYSLKGRYAEAEKTLAECMATGREANNSIIQGFTQYGLAFNSFNQGQYPDARNHIMACVPVAAKFATPEALALVYRLAYQVHDKLGREREALTYLKEFTTLNDRLQSEDLEKKAAIINANFEIQKKEDDLRLLAQQNAIQKMEIDQRVLTQRVTIGTVIAIALIVALMFNRIQNKRKFERIELQRKNEELEQARKVQLSLLPKQPLLNGVFEIHGKMITATEVGGDYFDFIPLDDHRVLIAFGDATGHGMTAGMMVTITKVALLNNLALLKNSNDVVPVARAVNESILASVSVKGIGMALQLCVVDAERGTLSMTSCGMPYPMIANAASGSLETTVIRQPPLGFMRGTRMELRELTFGKEDMLVLTSDGILERFNRTKEEYGLDRLTHLLKRATKQADLQRVLDSIFSDAETFASGVAHHDDMTALCARLRA
jgi:serine phosphatase RsbU (regulator of sigma subunit)